MKSMTGFASKTDDDISIKIKSVNHRFFDFRFHAPHELLILEKEVRQKINQVVSRGSLDLFVQIQPQPQSQKIAQSKILDLNKAKAFHKDLKKLSSTLKLELNEDLKLILKFGDVFTSDDTSHLNSKNTLVENSSFKKTDFLKSIDVLLKDFQAERIREGKALADEIKGLLVSLEKVRTVIDVLAEDYPSELELKIKEKIKTWKKSLKEEFDSERLNQELLLLIDKSDIKEEVVRLKEHIKACQKLLSSPAAEGKKLDFYAQELFREVNTIGSKSSSVKITGEVMQAKAIIEKIRQQVQNIE